jgi:transcription elongation factor Elf1
MGKGDDKTEEAPRETGQRAFDNEDVQLADCINAHSLPRSADGNATLICKICGQSFSCRTHALMAPIDVYSEWIDATEEVNG